MQSTCGTDSPTCCWMLRSGNVACYAFAVIGIGISIITMTATISYERKYHNDHGETNMAAGKGTQCVESKSFMCTLACKK